MDEAGQLNGTALTAEMIRELKRAFGTRTPVKSHLVALHPAIKCEPGAASTSVPQKLNSSAQLQSGMSEYFKRAIPNYINKNGWKREHLVNLVRRVYADAGHLMEFNNRKRKRTYGRWAWSIAKRLVQMEHTRPWGKRNAQERYDFGRELLCYSQ